MWPLLWGNADEAMAWALLRAGTGSSPLSKQTIITIAVAVGGSVIILALLGLLAVAWCACPACM